MARRRLSTRQLTVADHAANKQTGGEKPDQNSQVANGPAPRYRVSHCADGGGKESAEDAPLVPFGAVKGQNKAEQIKAEGKNPQERNRRNVLGDVVRYAKEQRGGASRQNHPHQAFAPRYPRALFAV